MALMLHDEDLFEADHAPGAMQVTASSWGCLILPPEHRPRWMASPYSYALHLTGREPMPQGDAKTLRRGKLMEPIGRELLRMDHQIDVVEIQPRRERPDVPAVCYLDGLVDAGWAVEMKSMPDRIYQDQWEGGPPWYVRVQAQAQMAIDQELAGVLIVPIVTGYSGNPDVPRVYEEPRDAGIGDLLVITARQFLGMLGRGELPAPDETIASYDAWSRTVEIGVVKTVLADDADAAQFRAWQMAKDQETGGEKLVAASKRYFAARAGDASVIWIPGVGQITRKQVPVKAEIEPRPARTDLRWSLKED
jgi:hypothetical protein